MLLVEPPQMMMRLRLMLGVEVGWSLWGDGVVGVHRLVRAAQVVLASHVLVRGQIRAHALTVLFFLWSPLPFATAGGGYFFSAQLQR